MAAPLKKLAPRTPRKNRATPAALGYRMPAEWAPHAATWIAWPHNPEDWPGRFPPIPWVYAEIVRHLAAAEPVHILVNDAAAEKRAEITLKDANVAGGNIRFHRWATNRVWTRDSGAIFLRGPKGLGATDWRFNGWAKYDDWRLDDKVAGRMAKQTKAQTWQPVAEAGGKEIRVVLEGGSIDVNGQGTLLTTEECLLSEVQARNPQLGREKMEKIFADYLGATKVIWLKRGAAGDDTHGHVDDIARFVSADTVMATVEEDPGDENHEPLLENLEILQRSSNESGRMLKVMELPMPSPVVFKGQRLPASYANFYVANGLVLAPTFDDPNDRVALNALADAFPGRKIVGIHCVDLIWGLGAIHCMTQQQPL